VSILDVASNPLACDICGDTNNTERIRTLLKNCDDEVLYMDLCEGCQREIQGFVLAVVFEDLVWQSYVESIVERRTLRNKK